MEDNREKRTKLAKDVLRLSRNQIIVNLRFMDAALSRLEETEIEGIPLATDGKYLVYDARHILRCYKADRAEPVRDYLHAVMHCVFRHNFVHTLTDRAAWDLACDIAVEHSIMQLGLRAAQSAREQRQVQAIQQLQKEVGMLTAEKVYRYLLDKNMHPIRLAELAELFRADDHRLWYMGEDEKAAMGLAGPGSSDGSGEGEGNDVRNGEGGGSVAVYGSEEDWKDVAERMQMDMEIFSKNQGRDPGAMLQNLREVNRERYDYAAFLKKFAVRGEAMKINDDEFDYIFYTYGLQLYENMPLIEPLEYKEVKRIREFVIAIDTSGSVAGETVQRFVQKTYNILKSTESFFTKINLHIIQCDAAIQEDAVIISQEDFDEYLKTMQIRGLGGTDFRPVFAYVDKLIESKTFLNLKGLIYFTDGFGTFPEKPPSYDAAFVFLQEEFNNPVIPPWAIKLILKKEEI
ncbi:MAG: metallopeptidase [Clostridia bacterium]|nr:metallopeptidase [Clostridia bacterium]